MVTACSDKGNVYCLTYNMDVETRTPIYDDRIGKSNTELLLELLSKHSEFIFHNRTFDVKMLSYIHPSVEEIILSSRTHDTIIAAHIIDNLREKGLKPLAKRYLGFPDTDEKELRDAVVSASHRAKKYGFLTAREGVASLPNADSKSKYLSDYWVPREVAKYEGLPSDHPWYTVCQKYAEGDVERTIGLFLTFQEYIKERSLEKVYELHNDEVWKPIYSIKNQGITLLNDAALSENKELVEGINKHTKVITGIAGDTFNFKSHQQLSSLLHDKFKLPIINRTESGAPSADQDTLALHYDSIKDSKKHKAASIFLSNLLDLKKLNTANQFVNSYLSYGIRTGKHKRYLTLFPNINQTGTATTRVSSNDPNGQNISKGDEERDEEGNKIVKHSLRRIFGPPPGKVWYAFDYSSLQLVIFAYESGDKEMIHTFETGGDIHNKVASAIFETDDVSEYERRIAKSVNYGLIFGATKDKIDATAGKEGAFELFENLFPSVPLFMPRIIARVKKFGKVHTAWGYPLHVNQKKAYVGVNYIVQGDEGEIVKRAMVNVHNFLSMNIPWVRLIFQIHDELLFECDEDKPFPIEEIKKCMIAPGNEVGWKLSVDGSIIRKNWAEKEKLK